MLPRKVLPIGLSRLTRLRVSCVQRFVNVLEKAAIHEIDRLSEAIVRPLHSLYQRLRGLDGPAFHELGVHDVNVGDPARKIDGHVDDEEAVTSTPNEPNRCPIGLHTAAAPIPPLLELRWQNLHFAVPRSINVHIQPRPLAGVGCNVWLD